VVLTMRAPKKMLRKATNLKAQRDLIPRVNEPNITLRDPGTYYACTEEDALKSHESQGTEGWTRNGSFIARLLRSSRRIKRREGKAVEKERDVAAETDVFVDVACKSTTERGCAVPAAK
jgi:hypothetical protein